MEYKLEEQMEEEKISIHQIRIDLGPLEAPYNSVNYKHNFSALEMVGHLLIY